MNRFAPNKARLGCPLAFGLIGLLLLHSDQTDAAVSTASRSFFGPDDFLVTGWQTEDGLPENTITSIAQTPDGYLWLGTFSGLARFDGVRFKIYDSANTPELESSRIVSVYPDAKGRLWVLSEFGHVARIEGEKISKLTAADGVPSSGIRWLVTDASGQLWATDDQSKTNYFSVLNDRFTLFEDTVPFVWRLGLITDAEGHGWMNGQNLVAQVGPKERRDYPYPPQIPAGGECVIGPAQGNGIWLVSERTAANLRAGAWMILSTNLPRIGSYSVLSEDASGSLWIGTWNQGLFVVNRTGKVEPVNLGKNPRPPAIRVIFHDNEDNVWVGTDALGLLRFKRRTFHHLDSASGLSADLVRSVGETSQGDLWVVTTAGVDSLSRTNGSFTKRLSLPIEVSWGVLPDRRDTIWVSTYGAGLHRYFDGQDLLLKSPQTTPRWSPHGTVLFEDSAGEFWFGSPEGLFRVVDAHLEGRETPVIKNRMDVRAMAEGKNQSLYVGLNGSGLLVRENGEWKQFGLGTGLNNEHVWSLHADSEGDLWIGTVGGGLCRYRAGKVHSYNFPETTLPRLITCILEDEDQFLWLGSNRGIYRVAISDLNAVADGRLTDLNTIRFGKDDGLPTGECFGGVQPSAFKARDGNLWFATYAGAAWVNPREVRVNPRAPAVLIENVRINSRPVESFRVREKQTIKVPAGSERIEFDFTGLSFTAPERIRFRYSLIGHDSSWLESGVDRTVRYSRLTPGAYRFNVIAANASGVWNRVGASVGLIVAPHYWETSSFKCLLVLVGGTLLIGAYRLSLARQRTIERMRLRIASDLHDEVGSNIGSIALKTELMQANHAFADDRVELAEINQVALQTAHEVRDVAWFINPQFDTTREMVLRMKDVASRMLAGRQWTFEESGTNDDRSLSLEYRRNVFFIFKEILHNIVKHSEAGRVRICVEKNDKWLKVTVQDNGRGFSTESENSGHGLRNLQRRADDLGGNIAVKSKVGEGTEVELFVPLRARRRFFARWFNVPETRDTGEFL
jgi:ligand-binding sensor domain-containing protein